jgi:hypothetical protein
MTSALDNKDEEIRNKTNLVIHYKKLSVMLMKEND